MIKFYQSLHTASNTLKKQFLSSGLFLLITLFIQAHTMAQCVPPPAPAVTPNPAFICLGVVPVKLKITSASSTFCSGSVNIPIPDNNVAGISNSIAVAVIPQNCSITGISVTINMAHTRISDMVLVLNLQIFLFS